MRVAVVQMDVLLGEAEENLARVRAGLGEAKAQGAELAVLPELWGTGYDTENWIRQAEPLGGGLFAESAKLAADLSIYLVAGSLLERSTDGRIFNTSTVWSPQGDLLGSYRKQHLFSLMGEDKRLSPGKERLAVDLCGLRYPKEKLRVGLGICYDLRFPGLFRSLALEACELLVIPAQWPEPRGLHWNRLLQARAIENLAYVVGANRVGGGETTRFCGQSLIINPWGALLADAGTSEPTVLIAEVDPKEVAKSRQTLPVLEDARRENAASSPKPPGL